MRARYLLVMFTVIAATLCGCKKEEAPTRKAVPMTLTASIASQDTKAVSSRNASGISFTWEENAQISVITLDSAGNLVTNDVFSSSNANGAAIATFTGSFTGGDDEGNTVMCLYPALLNNFMGYRTAKTVISNVKDKTGVIKLLQGNADPESDYIGGSTMLSGAAIISGSELSTVLHHRTAVIKVKADVSGTDLVSYSRIDIESSFENQFYSYNNSFYLADGYYDDSRFLAQGTPQNKRYIEFYKSVPVNSGEALVTYIPTSMTNANTPSGTTWKVKITGKNASDDVIVYSATKTFASAKTFHAGVCYTVNLSASDLTVETP